MSTSTIPVIPAPNDERVDAGPPAPRPRARKQEPHHDAVLRRALTSRRDRIIMYSVLAVMALAWAFPLYAAIRKSLEVHGLRNYASLFTEPVGDVSIPQTYLNTLIVGALHALSW